MSNIILKWIITSICQFLKRKNIIVMYDNVNTNIKRINVLKRYVSIVVNFESVSLFCARMASSKILLDYCTLHVSFQPKVYIVCIVLPYNVEIKLKIKKKGALKDFILELRNFSLDSFKTIFGNNIISTFMNMVESSSHIDIMARYEHDNTKRFPRIQYTTNAPLGFTVANSSIHIDKNYIIELLKKRNHLGHIYHTMEEIPAKVWQTVICTEDPMFPLHNGFCDVTLAMALRNAINSRHFSVGGSTITQQLIKNAMLTSERTLYRKAEELVLAVLAENLYHVPKDDILEIYINMIELAPNVYGMEDGAVFYFGKECSELNAFELLTLTYAIPRPRFFLEALEQKSEQRGTNLYSHIRTFYPTLIKKGIFEEKSIHKDSKQSIEALKGIMFASRFGFLKITGYKS